MVHLIGFALIPRLQEETNAAYRSLELASHVTYPSLVVVGTLRINSFVGHNIFVGIVHVASLASVVVVGNWTKVSYTSLNNRRVCYFTDVKERVILPEQSIMFCSLSRVSLP